MPLGKEIGRRLVADLRLQGPVLVQRNDGTGFDAFVPLAEALLACQREYQPRLSGFVEA